MAGHPGKPGPPLCDAQAVLDDVIDLLRCPHCRSALEREGSSVACPRGHSFDVARQGYLSLLPGDARRGTADSAARVAARADFLARGHFDRLATALADTCANVLAPGSSGAVVDLGAGTGWYLARVLDRLGDRPGLAIDLSKHALRRAAGSHARAGAVAADAWRPVPVRDGIAALVLSVFAPRDGAEVARILRPGGALVVAGPTGRHLGELVAELGLLAVDERRQERLDEKLAPHLEPAGGTELEWTLALDGRDVRNVVAMGPSALHVEPAALEEAIAGLGEPVEATASVAVSLFTARGAAQLP
jgi:23S rRNA (guanine745-N1)-methyltransferase